MKKRNGIIIGVIATIIIIVGVVALIMPKAQQAKYGEMTPGTLTVGLEGTYKPFNYVDNGKLTGYEVELVKDVANELGLKVKFVQSDWDSLIAGLGAGRFDAVFNNVSKNPQREQQYLFGSPYLYARTVLIKRNDETSLNTLGDIKGKNFAQSTTSNYGQTAQQNGANIVSVPGFTEAINLIETNRADGTINDKSAYEIWKSQNPNTNITAVSLDDSIQPIAAYPLFQKKSTKLQQAVDNAIQKLHDNGTLAKLSNEFFKTDLTNP